MFTDIDPQAFAHAMVGIPFHQNDIPPARLFIDYDGQEMGVSILEMDAVFTKDGVPVVWHDVSVSPLFKMFHTNANNSIA